MSARRSSLATAGCCTCSAIPFACWVRARRASAGELAIVGSSLQTLSAGCNPCVASAYGWGVSMALSRR